MQLAVKGQDFLSEDSAGTHMCMSLLAGSFIKRVFWRIVWVDAVYPIKGFGNRFMRQSLVKQTEVYRTLIQQHDLPKTLV
jgi:hypothetical protein